MNEAKVGSDVYTAEAFEALDGVERASLRPRLKCTGCDADAYFIRTARNGRIACFGARPHADGCELASVLTEDGGRAGLADEDGLLPDTDRFRLEPNRPASRFKHVVHDAAGEAHDGVARRYSRPTRGGVRTPSLAFPRLLRRLLRDPDFSASTVSVVLPDNTSAPVRDYCIDLGSVKSVRINRKAIYWGTIRYPNVASDGGAWLNLGGKGMPTLKVTSEMLEQILEAKGLDDAEDLAGAAFAWHGYMRRGGTGKLLLFPDDPDWFAVRLFDEDAQS